jgi:diguanylate cyclase (GGDEF)-like protein
MAEAITSTLSVVAANRGDDRRLRWSRRLMTAFWTCAALTWLWAMPGLPAGLTHRDYSSNVIAALVLCSSAFVTGGLALYLRSRISHADEGLRRLALYDPLTGLANRALFLDRLEHAAVQARRRNELIALLFLDLDQFKLINDRYGHAAGDEVLASLSQRLNQCVRAGDTVARLGGDEFTVLLESVNSVSRAAEVAERIVEALKAPFDWEGEEIFLSASIGIAATAEPAPQPADLLRQADSALYQAKGNGKGHYVLNVSQTGVAATNPRRLAA